MKNEVDFCSIKLYNSFGVIIIVASLKVTFLALVTIVGTFVLLLLLLLVPLVNVNFFISEAIFDAFSSSLFIAAA